MTDWRLHDKKRAHAAGAHRSGWPYVHGYLKEYSTDRGWVLYDFAELQFRNEKAAVVRPWVGIFHYPAAIDTPIPLYDKTSLIEWIFSQRHVRESVSTLQGVIVLTDALARKLDTMLPKHIPICVLKHPTQLDVPQWTPGGKTLTQVGFFLRDTRAIFKVEPRVGWQRKRFDPHAVWMKSREMQLMRAGDLIPEHAIGTVVSIPRLSNDMYDHCLASDVMLTWLHGAEANNVVVECLARATPLCVNYHASVAEYLGEDYPLYLRSKQDLAKCLDLCTPDKLLETHEYLKMHRERSPWLGVTKFAADVNDAIEELQTARLNGVCVDRG